MWICDPDFAKLKPVNTLHKQMDKAAAVEPDPSLKNRHMLARRAFEAGAGEKLTLSITADDYYKLYLNGELIGVGPAQAYADRYPVNHYDLTPFVKPGKNVLAAHVFYMGTVTRAWQSGDNRQGLWLRLTREDGSVLLESDRSFKALCAAAWREKGLLGYETQFIEEVFGAEIPDGWKEVDFDDAAWLPACENSEDDHVLVDQLTPPVCVYEQKPALIERRGDVWFADMGREIVGTVHCAAKASGGGVIELRMGEELNEDGTVRWKMRCNCDYRLWWHLSGRDRDETDFFDYMAFRYIEIVDPEGRVEPENVGVTARHYPMPEDRGHFRCEMPLLNGIFDICRRGVQLGAQEAFLDCPSREKGQYLGDGTITAHAHLLLTGDARMYKKMLLDFAASARVCPGLMAVAPGNEMQEIADYSCQYPEQIMTYYELTGDIDTVRQLMPVVDALEDYFDRFRTDGGLIENVTEKWNLVDWPANLRDGYDFELSQPIGPGKHNVINAFYYGLKKDADRMRALLALPPRNEAEAVRRAFIAAFRKEDGLFRDALGSEHTALHSAVLPLYYGITEPEDVAPAVALIRERGLCCGVYMACFVLKALARNGEYDLMNALLLSEDEHSWGNMLREGATSCWEAWGKDQKWNTSLCHPWASAPIILLMEDVAGIRPEKPGFDGLVQTPHAPVSLGDIDLSFGTVRGVVRAARRGGQWSLTMA